MPFISAVQSDVQHSHLNECAFPSIVRVLFMPANERSFQSARSNAWKIICGTSKSTELADVCGV